MTKATAAAKKKKKQVATDLFVSSTHHHHHQQQRTDIVTKRTTRTTQLKSQSSFLNAVALWMLFWSSLVNNCTATPIIRVARTVTRRRSSIVGFGVRGGWFDDSSTITTSCGSGSGNLESLNHHNHHRLELDIEVIGEEEKEEEDVSSMDDVTIMKDVKKTTTNSNIDGKDDDGAINEKKRRVTTQNDGKKYPPMEMPKPSSNSSNSNDKDKDKFRRGFYATKHRSHLMHAIEGLDRYPNYISRWNNMDDVDELESALEQTLQKVRQQKHHSIQTRTKIRSLLSNVSETNPDVARLLQPPTTWDEIRHEILDTRASDAIFKSRQFRGILTKQISNNGTSSSPSDSLTVEQVMNGLVDVDIDTSYLEQLMEEEVSDVYSFPLLSSDFCKRIQTYVRTIWREVEQHNEAELAAATTTTTSASASSISEQNYRLGMMVTRDLDCLGLSWLNDLLFHLIVRPVSRQLYQETELEGYNGYNTSSSSSTRQQRAELDWRHGFIAAYSADTSSSSSISSSSPSRQPRKRLVPHTDDSEVTLNVCLGDTFDGGELVFWGNRADISSAAVKSKIDSEGEGGDHYEAYSPQIGRAVIHAGRQLHEVTEVTSGDRFALIMWTRSWNGIRSTTCPCCWLNCRTTGSDSSSCTCGRRWN